MNKLNIFELVLGRIGGCEVNLDLMKANARIFYKAAERCNEKRPLPDEKIEWLAVPAIVNLAFSAELYLKYLIAKNVKSSDELIKKHELSKLFESLDPTTRSEIIKANNYKEDKFKELLDKHSKTFIEWRYIHETSASMQADTLFLKNLIDSLEVIANRP